MTFRQGRLSDWKKYRRGPSKNKYHANAGYCLSDHFHRSQLEMKTCDELRLRKIAKDIKDYRVEVTYPLKLGGVNLGTYRADFVVEENDGTTEIIDAKGIQFALFKQKWKIMQAMFKRKRKVKFRIVTR